MDNVIIDIPERIDSDIEDFKIGAVDDEQNFTTARIKLCREPENDQPILFYTQELSRNFKRPADPFGRRHIIKTFTPANLEAVADTALEHKFKDTLLAHKDTVWDYSPLTDIHSQKMNLFLDEDTATFMSDVGVNVDGLGDDFQSMESIESTPFMDEVSLDATRLKNELHDLKGKMLIVKDQMADEFSEYVNPRTLTSAEFDTRLAMEKISDGLVQSYLMLKEQITGLESQLGQVRNTVFSETKTRIKLPKLIEERSTDGLFQI